MRESVLTARVCRRSAEAWRDRGTIALERNYSAGAGPIDHVNGDFARAASAAT